MVKKFILKYWLFILLSTVATVLLILFFVFRDRNTDEESQKKLIPLKKPEINNQSSIKPQIDQLENNFPSFNENLMVYQVDDYIFNQEETIKIAQEFGFTKEPEITSDESGQIYSWSDATKNLSIYLKDGIINYGLDLLQNPELVQGEAPSIEEAEIKSKNFLERINLLTPGKINLDLKKGTYIKLDQGYFNETNKNDPQKKLTNLNFAYKINNYEIQGFNPVTVDVFLDSQFNIVNLRSKKIFQKVEELDSYPIKNKKEVILSLKENPQISFLKDLKNNLPSEITLEKYSLEKIKQINFNKIELIYFKNENYQSYLQPVYLITGDALLTDVGWVQAGLFIPAIKDKYLLK